jgi:hypothetical protein
LGVPSTTLLMLVGCTESLVSESAPGHSSKTPSPPQLYSALQPAAEVQLRAMTSHDQPRTH